MSKNGIVFNILRYTLDDGPGIRSTVFLKGCPLKCPWCANPESQLLIPEISLRKISCVQCNRCIANCPQQAITMTEKGAKIDRSKCIRCQQCVQACPNKAMETMGKSMTVEEVWKVVKKDMDFYIQSSGGVTVSGGEPLMQADFLVELLKRFREENLHTCLDTTGFCSSEDLERVLPYVCLFYFDLKHMDSAKHQQVVGVPNEPIHRNLRRILEAGIPVAIRIPYIPGFNADDENIEATARFVSEIQPGGEIHLLPYHRYGTGKYEMLDLEYTLGDTQSPSDEQLEHSKNTIEGYGLKCVVASK